MKNSLMYRLCFYRFGEVRTRADQPSGYDTVRNAEIGLKDYDLTYFREAYTSERWIVRIYEVLPLTNRDGKFETRFKDSKPPKIAGASNTGSKMEKMPTI
jgi:dolichyl-diphosphooligosaccharide--protein glycosyltransferase